MSAAQTLIFDCDGVLVDSEAIAEATLIELLDEWLPDLATEAVLRQALGMTTANILRHLESQSRHRLPVDATQRVDTTIEGRLAEELQAVPGVAAAIAAIPLPKAVVSNSRRQRVEASLATTGLAALLGEAPIFTADEVARPKPDPALYRLAAARLGVDAGQCLVIEDSVAGVTAAHAAGMTVVGFIGASHIEAGQAARLNAAGAWRVIDHMQQLAALVSDWCSAGTSIPARRNPL
ncbi:haloacid dehalogenase superfamily, subfamily IA, variant 3 with third motif having DD or ED [Franzmannia pantelleriensis]|uniref:Haloacid dehalogenase superfamily, subfamily IA, variant 3 with third motif having DD or ED n=1 Tax=Franzmannia pantelleriensis TaxID=48727 RepID=A0A1G9GEF9_9GAMM|nr:HAD family phosphatase [Halomonas pantelleriensis]SDK98955.1 haloacid dehalogenase superfamily, subfamily IA, variant 3 with third motif having DD or ED [Halomonas pantelleriensis]